MFGLRVPNVVVGVASVALALIAANAPRVVAQDAGSDLPTAAELLEDGTDAAADNALDSAGRIFRQIISDYPASPEAARARRALARLGQDANAPDAREAIRADEAEHAAQYRHAFLIDAGDRVFFAENSATIGGRSRGVIANQARWLKARPDLRITVIGRSDDGGGAAIAKALSLQRAEAVRDRLILSGLDAQRITVRAEGEQDRIAVCDLPLCQAQNRNVEVFIEDLQDGGEWQSGDASQAPRAALRAAAQAGELERVSR